MSMVNYGTRKTARAEAPVITSNAGRDLAFHCSSVPFWETHSAEEPRYLRICPSAVSLLRPPALDAIRLKSQNQFLGLLVTSKQNNKNVDLHEFN